MFDTSTLGKFLVGTGIMFVLLGFLLMAVDTGAGWPGNLPGDIRIEGENYSIYIPLATMLLLSVVLSLLLRIIGWFL